MDIEIIRNIVRTKRYHVKLHAVQHALQEGFGEKEILAALLTGAIIETYPERGRILVCGKAMFDANMEMYLHVVCEQNWPDQIEIVTAYVPSRLDWGEPPIRRKSRRK